MALRHFYLTVNHLVNCGCLSQAAKHSKDSEVAAEVKAQLKEKIEPKQDPLAEVILAAGKAKLAKKPHDKQTELTSAFSAACMSVMQQAAGASCSHLSAKLGNDQRHIRCEAFQCDGRPRMNQRREPAPLKEGHSQAT